MSRIIRKAALDFGEAQAAAYRMERTREESVEIVVDLFKPDLDIGRPVLSLVSHGTMSVVYYHSVEDSHGGSWKPYRFLAVGTNWPIPDGLRYVGTWTEWRTMHREDDGATYMAPLVWHVFDGGWVNE